MEARTRDKVVGAPFADSRKLHGMGRAVSILCRRKGRPNRPEGPAHVVRDTNKEEKKEKDYKDRERKRVRSGKGSSV